MKLLSRAALQSIRQTENDIKLIDPTVQSLC